MLVRVVLHTPSRQRLNGFIWLPLSVLVLMLMLVLAVVAGVLVNIILK